MSDIVLSALFDGIPAHFDGALPDQELVDEGGFTRRLTSRSLLVSTSRDVHVLIHRRRFLVDIPTEHLEWLQALFASCCLFGAAAHLNSGTSENQEHFFVGKKSRPVGSDGWQGGSEPC